MALPWLMYSVTIVFLAALTTAENVLVTCGSSIKLQHVGTKYRLHSHEVAYSRGSQQQSVTAFPTGEDGNSYWVVLGTQTSPCVPGESIKKGQAIRLQHTATRKWLHSHEFTSPLTSNLEVSAFGSDTQSDTGDIWIVEWDGKSKNWKQDTKVRFKHQDTDAYLYSHEARFGHPIAGQQEVCGLHRKDRNAEWQAAEGVYFPVAKAAGKAAAAAAAPEAVVDTHDSSEL